MTGFDLTAGGASSGSLSSFWLEETPTSPSSPLYRKGRLYIIAEGAAHETESTIKAIRDGYFGDIPRSNSKAANDLRLAVQAANALLYSRGGIGVSCLCAVIYDDGQLAVQHLGDCRAYLLSSNEGSLERVTEGQYATKSLGAKAKVELGEINRRLEAGDVLLLCSGTVAETIDEEELGDLASTALTADPKRLAQRIVARATARDRDAEAAAIVIACKPTKSSRQMAMGFDEADTSEIEDEEEETPIPQPTPIPPEPRLVGLRRLLAGLGRAVKAGLFLALLSLVGVAIFLGYRAFQETPLQTAAATPTPVPWPTISPIAFSAQPGGSSDAMSSATPIGTTPPAIAIAPGGTMTPTPTGAEAMRRVEALWPLGDQGSIAALEEIVSLLEEQTRTKPDDKALAQKLTVSRANLTYRQGMKQVETDWPTTTGVGTVLGWSKAVELLESLYVQPALAGYRERIIEKLYVAHLNYGKALEAAGRNYEAWGQYQRALQIDPSRPEASAALRRF